MFPLLKEGEGQTGTSCALDCGAGIGRISKRLLLPLFTTVDLVDVTQEFLDQAKVYLGEEGRKVGNYICKGLQDFVPESGRYDVIWIQWVIGWSSSLVSISSKSAASVTCRTSSPCSTLSLYNFLLEQDVVM